MELKTKVINLQLANFEADDIEEELQSLIFDLGKEHKEQMEKYPELNKLRELLVKYKNTFN